MRNYHETSRLITAAEIERLDAAFQASWGKDTAFPANQEIWSEANKAFSQCVPTALVVFDFYGGEFAYDEGVNHCWNIFPDRTQHDFSRSQFTGAVPLRITRVNTREYFLETDKGKAVNNPQRYALLRQRVNQALQRR